MPDRFSRFKNINCLVIGAGGIGNRFSLILNLMNNSLYIGCELLKNLVLNGFWTIQVIDLDTIDVSNLNRQFLFRPEHVNQSKAKTASEMIKKFCPEVNVQWLHANIKEERFNIDYFSKFDLVFNALDNISARRHVNRLCLAADVPLIESGSTGYLGQCQVIVKGETECYECQPKPPPVRHPICTIRSTPEKPVHTIVWGKELFQLLFGEMRESMLFEDDEVGNSAFMNTILSPECKDEEGAVGWARRVVEVMFVDEINNKIQMGIYSGARTAPSPLSPNLIHSSPPSSSSLSHNQRHVLEEEEAVSVLVSIIVEFYYHDSTLKARLGSHSFDKDNKLAMEFVSAASNLRSRVFNIPLQSLYDAKGVAGNIIPAIASTNAIVASLQVLQAVKLVDNLGSEKRRSEGCKFMWCHRYPAGRRKRSKIIQPSSLDPPNPSCFICSSPTAVVEVDCSLMTVDQFVDHPIKRGLGFNQPSLLFNSSIIHEEGEEAEDVGYGSSLLQEVGIGNGSSLIVEDFTQDLILTIFIEELERNEEEEEEEDEILFKIKKRTEGSSKEQKDEIKEMKTKEDEEEDEEEEIVFEDEEDLVIIEQEEEESSKRKRSEIGDEDILKHTKKMKS